MDGFEHVRVRRAVVWLLGAFALCVPLHLIGWKEISTTMLVIYLGLAAWVVDETRRARIPLPELWGAPPTTAHSWSWLGLVLPLLASAIGSLWLVYYPLSWLAPGYVEEFLRGVASDDSLSVGHGSVVKRVSTILLVVVAAPLTEELVFRGVLLRRWMHRWGPLWGIGLSSLAFGALHHDLLGSTLFGVVMSVLYLHTRSLWIPIACHALNNGIAIGVDALEHVMGRDLVDPFPSDLAELQAGALAGLGTAVVTFPILLYVVYRLWPRTRAALRLS